LAQGFAPALEVTSYIRPGMLTHSLDEAQAYADDPLITRRISARLLLELAHAARRIVATASSIETPVLMLLADEDWVVHSRPQQRFFAQLSSPFKRLVRLRGCRHAIFYEHDAVREQAIAETRAFILACENQTPLSPERHHTAHLSSASAQAFQALKQGDLPWPQRAFYALQRHLLHRLGPGSQGMHIGLTQGFDSGASLDYVYQNQARGRTLLGQFIDQNYLNAIGWRGIRQRRWQLQQLLSECIETHPPEQPLHLLDVAAGGGRYVLETAKRFQDRHLHLTLRDIDPHNLEQAHHLADRLGLEVTLQACDAFAPSPPPLPPQADGGFDIAIVSGLYELFDDNALVLHALQQVVQQLKPGGLLIYTGQPWHPQQALIACTLRNHQGQPWLMRPRPQAELDALVHSAGAHKRTSRIGLDGIFTVSLAQKT
jgi:SAM-dependent methyltransferase